MHKKGLYAICGQCRPRSVHVQADQDPHCPLTESADTAVFFDRECPKLTAQMHMPIGTFAVHK